ncbi:hypothetical protein Y032_0306g2001 [Ancylostoma ceylanicum]|nr:hypothetical protein Y032_0306g2001 [Ancylostoma ceylanicum]
MAHRSQLEELKNYGFDAAFAEQIDLCGVGVIRYLGINNLLWISTTPIMDAVSYNLASLKTAISASEKDHDEVGVFSSFTEFRSTIWILVTRRRFTNLIILGSVGGSYR